MQVPYYKSGFVTICGCPNVGKSTLLNRLVGQKIAIVSHRAQTTRNKITGVLTRKDYQIIFLDTPGVTGARNKLGDYMQKAVSDALTEVEAVLLVLDPTAGVRERDLALMERLKKAKAPILVVLNKRDIASAAQMDAARKAVEESGLPVHQLLTISAETGDGVADLEEALKPLLVEGPQYFPEDMVTDQPERVICGEMIREKALQLLREEVPHGIGVSMDRMELRPEGDLMDVYATIYCERDSHKGIIIGRGGSMLKRIGAESRKDMEWMMGLRINLQLFVKVKEDWRNKPSVLKELGYE
ncbi:MAG: GTPase Era [Clostridia bacterium]|nr:GTPase Era [Clostridia bacterium]